MGLRPVSKGWGYHFSYLLALSGPFFFSFGKKVDREKVTTGAEAARTQ